MWHLVIPPVMTLLDDYETKYKLQGVIIVEEMLRRVPKDLLKRTGVDGLLRQVGLTTCRFTRRILLVTSKSVSVMRCPILKARRPLIS
jgi:hypothetical protein